MKRLEAMHTSNLMSEVIVSDVLEQARRLRRYKTLRNVSPRFMSRARQTCQGGVFSGATNVVKKIGGQAPQTLEDFVHDNLIEFTARSA